MPARPSGPLRCLFLADDHPITRYPTGGGPAILYSHLELLHHAGVDVALALLETSGHSYGFRDYRDTHSEGWAKVRSWLSRDPLIVRSPYPTRGRLESLLLAMFSPSRFIYGKPHDAQRAAVRSLIAEHSPDFIWAELLHPAVVARQIAPDVPIVYGHQDWFWQIFWLLGRDLRRARSLFRAWVCKRLEYRLAREVLACVSGSATESAQLERLGAPRVLYLPPTSEPVDESGLPTGGSRPRVVQFGGMRTAANRIGVLRFLQRAWPVVLQSESQPPELWVIGPMEGAPDSLRRELERAQAVCPGYVEDMATVLRPDDIHVIPWEWDTGTRARVPVALNYRQALISTRAAVACLPELTDGKDCIIVDDLESLGGEILRLLRDHPLRRELACAGRATLLKHFTREALQPRFDRFVEQLRSDLGVPDRPAPSSSAVSRPLRC